MSCSNQNKNHFSTNHFNEIKLLKYNKKKVQFLTSFNFLNESEKDVTIKNSDFDISINKIDISSHINNSPIVISTKKNYEIPIKVEFNPSKVFKDYESGITKIKTDIIASVRISGIITIVVDSKEKEIAYLDEQAILFTNNKKIKLNNEGEIIPRD